MFSVKMNQVSSVFCYPDISFPEISDKYSAIALRLRKAVTITRGTVELLKRFSSSVLRFGLIGP
jgi:hypothetical protein